MAYERNCEIKPGMEFPEDMHRIALGLEYSGANYRGFQKQASTNCTVQENLERALTTIANEDDISIVCAGRTDAGVHATGQVIHFDTLAIRPEKAWVLGTNTKLPDAIRVVWAKEISKDFHARFSATQRIYRYIFHCSEVRSSILQKQVTHCPRELDFRLMERASHLLVGEHDFSAFRSSQCQAHNPVRKIEEIAWARQGKLVAMQIRANAFLHHMVRNIVGSLIEVGSSKKSPDWITELLESKNRCLAGATAAPWGLYLTQVVYPRAFNLPIAEPGPPFFEWDDHSR